MVRLLGLRVVPPHPIDRKVLAGTALPSQVMMMLTKTLKSK